MKNWVEKTLRYGSFIFVFLAPLMFTGQRLYPHISTKTFFIYGGVEVLFFVWLYALILDPSYRISKKTFLWFIPAAGFVVWMSVAGVFAMNPHLSFWSSFSRGTGLLTLYHCLAFSFLLASLIKKYGIPYLASLCAWFIAGASVLAVSIWLGTDGFNFPMTVLQKDAGGGFAGNSTLAAGYLLFALALVGFLLASKNLTGKKKKFIIGALAIIIFSPVFLSLYSFFFGTGILGTARGTLLGLGAGVASAAISYLFLSKKKAFQWLSVGIVAMGIITFAFLWAQLITPNAYLNIKFAEQARSSRFIFWEIAQKAMDERPIFGYGPENYSVAYQKYFNPQILVLENNFEGWNDRAHNIYYELGSTAGYPGIALYTLFLLSLFYASYRAYRQGRITRGQASILAGLLVGYMVNNLFTFDSNLSLMSLFLVAGTLYALGAADHVAKENYILIKPTELNKNLIFIGLFALLVVSWIFLTHLPSRKSRAYAEIFTTPINKRPAAYPLLLRGSSMGIDWDVSELAFGVYKKYASNPSLVKNDQKLLPYAIEDITALLQYLEKVAVVNKTDYRLSISRVFLQNNLTYLTDAPYREDEVEKIEEILAHAKKLSPTNPNVYWSIAQVKVWTGDFKGAEVAYRDAIAVDPTLESSHRLFVNFAKTIGNERLYREALLNAQEMIPGFSLTRSP